MNLKQSDIDPLKSVSYFRFGFSNNLRLSYLPIFLSHDICPLYDKNRLLLRKSL